MTGALAAATRPVADVSLRDLRDVDPYPAYERMRAAGNVVWDEGMAAWLVLDHDGCAFVERREDLFEEPTRTLPGAAEIVGRRDFRSLVGAPHDALHRSLSHAWRPDPIARQAASAVRPIVTARLSTLAGTQRFELFADFARLLPIAVVARMLGLPDADAATLDQAKGWMEAVLAWRHSYGEDAEARQAAVVATRALEPALVDTVRERRDRPAEDAISLLWAAGREIFPDWDERDVIDNAKFLFEAGSETTAFLICNAIHVVFQQPPEQRAAWLADRDAFTLFLEEVLRHTTVVHLRARRATADTTLGGVAIAAGERMIAVNAAANRDPGRWRDPARFDPSRPRLFSHLAFNVGPRHCAGAHLARIEAFEAVVGLFTAFPDLALAADTPPSRSVGLVSRAWRPIELVRARRDPARCVSAARRMTATSTAAVPPDLLHTEQFRRDPFPAWRRLRHDAPIWHDPVADRWIVTRYDDVLAVFRDPATYAVGRPYRRFSEQIGPSLVNLDGSAHRTRRAIVAPELVGRRIEHVRPMVARRIAALFERWPDSGAVDAWATVASPLPLLVIADLLGLDETDHEAFARHSAAILSGLGGDAAAAAEGRGAHAALAALFDPRIDAAYRDPGDDLISHIVRAEVDGQWLSRAEVHSFVSLLLVAGGETTGLAIANTWATVAGAPDVQAALASDEDPALLDAVISEALRHSGPVIAEDREVTRDVEWHGTTVPAGATLRAVIGSANRDETVFADPDRFNPWRRGLHPGKESRHGGPDADGRAGHLTFGAGDHSCLGYQLARVEIAAATSALLDRWPEFEAAPEPAFAVELELMRHVQALTLSPGSAPTRGAGR